MEKIHPDICDNCEGAGCWHCDMFVELIGGPRDGQIVARGKGDMVFADFIGFYDKPHCYYSAVWGVEHSVGGIPIYYYAGSLPA